jgi:gamma-glutamyl-gamma-aminobutyrate hydrolase PuuD
VRVRRPLIAVTGRHLRPGRINLWTAGGVALPRGYTDALERAGANAVLVPPAVLDDESDAVERLAPFAGLVLTGGGDINPARYGQDPHPKVYGIDDELDRFEIALTEAALEAELPILAICRGHQLLNIVLGGDLDQHINERQGVIAHGLAGSGPGGGIDHEVTIAPGTRLAEALGTTRATVRSHHHQAVSTLADKAIATAFADDGVNEGFELPDAWVVSVQWHPETTAGEDPVQQNLFDAFVAAC